ncbi:hypothetical protein LOAG_07581 [Loa loa]|uniref:Uncharacterized protein n=1 Tax=Loa loa TaxID=7209 RepID=A0A1S0TVA1_LOALO|nr:hypothetical protein LOAG_07581 [Loa loa]EFO20906.1 hypothetical protein LOAG_07581 [Loa loa]
MLWCVNFKVDNEISSVCSLVYRNVLFDENVQFDDVMVTAQILAMKRTLPVPPTLGACSIEQDINPRLHHILTGFRRCELNTMLKPCRPYVLIRKVELQR